MRSGAAGGSAAPAPPPFVRRSTLAQRGGSGPGLLAAGPGWARRRRRRPGSPHRALPAPSAGGSTASRCGSAARRGWLAGGFSKGGPIAKWPRLSRRSCGEGLGGVRGWFPHGCRPSSRGASWRCGRAGGAAVAPRGQRRLVTVSCSPQPRKSDVSPPRRAGIVPRSGVAYAPSQVPRCSCVGTPFLNPL